MAEHHLSRLCSAEQIKQLVQSDPHNPDIRRVEADDALEQLIVDILTVGVVALSEADAVEAYRAGSCGIGKVLDRIARDADRTARRTRAGEH